MNPLPRVAISPSQSQQEMEWVQKGKSVHVDAETGVLKLSDLKNMLFRIFIPTYSEKQDLAVAQYLIKKLEKVSSGVGSISITKPTDVQRLKATETFLHKRLKSYNSAQSEIVVTKQKLQHFLNMDKISKKLGVSFDVLKANPNFVKFAITNHLHNRIDKTYQERGLGITVIENKIFVKERYVDQKTGKFTRSGQLMEWTKIPTDSQGKIKGWELMAYGWQPHEKTKAVKLEPVKIITLNPGEKPQYAIELVTAKPTYNLANLGLGTFGHSWLRVYEPCLDKWGKPTNQVAVYSVGYNLKSLVSPDIFEFVEREKVTTKEVLTEEKFLRVKKNLESIMEVLNQDNDERTSKTDLVKGIEHWVESNCITCGTFAAKTFEDFTGKHIDGRLLVMKVLVPESWRNKVADLTSQIPFFKGKLKKIVFFTHGYFPSVMFEDQAKLANC